MQVYWQCAYQQCAHKFTTPLLTEEEFRSAVRRVCPKCNCDADVVGIRTYEGFFVATSRLRILMQTFNRSIREPDSE